MSDNTAQATGDGMSEERAPSWYDDAPITDEQLDAVREFTQRGMLPAVSRYVAQKLLAEVDQLRARLAEIGETGAEWTVRYANGDMLYASSESYARATAGRDASATLMRRTVAEWREVPDAAEVGQ